MRKVILALAALAVLGLAVPYAAPASAQAAVVVVHHHHHHWRHHHGGPAIVIKH